MKIVIITGASSGLGYEFASQAAEMFKDIDCFWLIARRTERLEELAAKLPVKAEAISLDLCSEDGIATLSRRLKDEKPEVKLLINNAGCGYLGNVDETKPELISRMIDLNVRAMSLVANAVIPFMPKSSHIINVSSIASFCANPRMTVYSSTKAYVSSFTHGLRQELKSKGISVTAVCPGPMATEFLDVGNITGNSKMFQTLPYSDPKKVVAGTLRAAKSGRTIYTPKVLFKVYRVLAKLIPHALLTNFTKT